MSQAFSLWTVLLKDRAIQNIKQYNHGSRHHRLGQALPQVVVVLCPVVERNGHLESVKQSLCLTCDISGASRSNLMRSEMVLKTTALQGEP